MDPDLNPQGNFAIDPMDRGAPVNNTTPQNYYSPGSAYTHGGLGEEVALLRAQINDLQIQVENGHDAHDDIIEDLTRAHEEAAALRTQLDAEQTKTARLQAQLASAASPAEERASQKEAELKRLQHTMAQLTADLQSKEGLISLREKELVQWSQWAQAREAGIKSSHQAQEDRIRQTEERANLSEKLLRDVEVRESAARAETQRLESELRQVKMEQDSSQNEIVRELRAKVEELVRLSNFFKANSEKWSRQARDMKAQNTRLEETIKERDRDLQEQKSLVCALKIARE